MFDFAWSHILLLLIVAVVFLGPKELPVVLRYLGKIFAKFRQHREELQEYVEAAIAPLEKPHLPEPVRPLAPSTEATSHDSK